MEKKKTKQEILESMKKSKTWRELCMTVAEVYDAFSQIDENTETKEMRDKIFQLTETNKKLRAENKALRESVKKQ